jgi:hypothetical protein
MNRREALKVMGIGAACLSLPLKLKAPKTAAALTITRPNFGVVHFYDHETLPNYNVNDYGTSDFNLEKAFGAIDFQLEKVSQDIDLNVGDWKRANEYYQQINKIADCRKFVWAGWITRNSSTEYFNLFLFGQDNHRFNYRPDKVCMWERQMYAGDGMGDQLLKFDFYDTPIYGKCDRYWGSGIGDKAIQRYRYALEEKSCCVG